MRPHSFPVCQTSKPGQTFELAQTVWHPTTASRRTREFLICYCTSTSFCSHDRSRCCLGFRNLGISFFFINCIKSFPTNANNWFRLHIVVYFLFKLFSKFFSKVSNKYLQLSIVCISSDPINNEHYSRRIDCLIMWAKVLRFCTLNMYTYIRMYDRYILMM